MTMLEPETAVGAVELEEERAAPRASSASRSVMPTLHPDSHPSRWRLPGSPDAGVRWRRLQRRVLHVSGKQPAVQRLGLRGRYVRGRGHHLCSSAHPVARPVQLTDAARTLRPATIAT